MAYIGNEPGKASQRVVDTFTATASQTTFTPSSGYTLGYMDVYLNGVRLINGDDYTATNGTTVVLSSGVSANDVVQCVAYIPRGLSDGYTTSQADTRFAQRSNNLSDLASASTARTNLGLGTLATVSPTGTASSTTFLRGDNSWQTVSVTPTAVSSQANSATDYFDLPAGTTAQRPASPAVGMVRYNTTLGYAEWYGGSPASWSAFYSQSAYSIEYLVLAGGGSGGYYSGATHVGGGGGAGGYVTGLTSNITPTSTITVTVGGGGAGGTSNTSGTNSSISGSLISTVTAIGGGLGGYSSAAASGGSGGGGSSSSTSGASGTSGQGFAGGTGGVGTNYWGGGGGGATAVGANGSDSSGGTGGNGGAGTGAFSVWASATSTGSGGYYAGGGGGAARQPGGASSVAGSGGAGGGGTGGSETASRSGTSGATNTGSGGGGAHSYGGNGGSGGSGIVIFRYAGAQRGTGGTIVTTGGYTYHTFTSSGTFTA